MSFLSVAHTLRNNFSKHNTQPWIVRVEEKKEEKKKKSNIFIFFVYIENTFYPKFLSLWELNAASQVHSPCRGQLFLCASACFLLGAENISLPLKLGATRSHHTYGGSFNLESNNHLANWVYNRAAVFIMCINEPVEMGRSAVARSKSVDCFHGRHQKHMRDSSSGEGNCFQMANRPFAHTHTHTPARGCSLHERNH